jgi:hypothetical protein
MLFFSIINLQIGFFPLEGEGQDGGEDVKSVPNVSTPSLALPLQGGGVLIVYFAEQQYSINVYVRFWLRRNRLHYGVLFCSAFDFT